MSRLQPCQARLAEEVPAIGLEVEHPKGREESDRFLHAVTTEVVTTNFLPHPSSSNLRHGTAVAAGFGTGVSLFVVDFGFEFE